MRARSLALIELKSVPGIWDDVFWDSFYELLESGELESNHKGEFLLSDKTKNDWEKYYTSLQLTNLS